MGMVGTMPALGRTLLVGDAAGLVNPLQGEGIAPALRSGRDAAVAVLAVGPPGAAAHYRAALAVESAPFASSTAALAAWMLRRPRVAAGVGRLLTAPGISGALADGWVVYWYDLLEGAVPGRGRRLASVADLAARLATGWGDDNQSVWRSVGGSPPGWPLRHQPPIHRPLRHQPFIHRRAR